MKGLDTNVLVRYLVGDDKRQAARAAAFIEHVTAVGGTCFINTIVICETAWVLESAYGFGRDEIAAVLERLLVTRQLEFESKELVREAISDYRRGSGDLADLLLGHVNASHGCDRTATFDRGLVKSPLFEVID